MEISFNKKYLELHGFRVLEKTIAGDLCYLVTPDLGHVDWTRDTLIFRSSIWAANGYLVSPSFKKFFNFDERPDIAPFTQDMQGWSIIEKVDGSTLIVSKYKNELILRTRGSFDASQMPNGKELELFRKSPAGQYISNLPEETLSISYIFEWVTPSNQIVLQYPEIDFYLIAIINHDNYSMFVQSDLDYLAKEVLHCKRPTRYSFSSVRELINDVKSWEGKEGVCLYYNYDQNIRKIKSLHYLKLHAFRSNCTIKHLAELVDSKNYPSKEVFMKYIEAEFDYECLKQSEPVINKLYSVISEVDVKIAEVKYFVSNNSYLSQKDFAMLVKQDEMFKTYSVLQSIAFNFRKGSDVLKSKKAFIEQLLKV